MKFENYRVLVAGIGFLFICGLFVLAILSYPRVNEVTAPFLRNWSIVCEVEQEDLSSWIYVKPPRIAIEATKWIEGFVVDVRAVVNNTTLYTYSPFFDDAGWMVSENVTHITGGGVELWVPAFYDYPAKEVMENLERQGASCKERYIGEDKFLVDD